MLHIFVCKCICVVALKLRLSTHFFGKILLKLKFDSITIFVILITVIRLFTWILEVTVGIMRQSLLNLSEPGAIFFFYDFLWSWKFILLFKTSRFWEAQQWWEIYAQTIFVLSRWLPRKVNEICVYKIYGSLWLVFI